MPPEAKKEKRESTQRPDRNTARTNSELITSLTGAFNLYMQTQMRMMELQTMQMQMRIPVSSAPCLHSKHHHHHRRPPRLHSRHKVLP